MSTVESARLDESPAQGLVKMRILFIAGFGPIVRDLDASRSLYGKALGISFKEEQGGYLHTEALNGAKNFSLWPLSQAAESCFGSSLWPDNLPAPHAWLEFDVDDVERATAELESMGHRMLIKNKTEPWGQTVSRFLDADGILVGLTFTPSMREKR
jgi:catechol 2,3-dioxygenase-like lactoylglutathione lyase family enzyme